jgi:hypothetical protein
MSTIEYIYRIIGITAVALLRVVAAAAQTINIPVYVNGVLSSAAGSHIQVVATFHYISECSSPVTGLERCAIHVHLSIPNNQPTDLDFDPQESSMSMGGVTVVPMDEERVHTLGDNLTRHHRGHVGNAEFQDATNHQQTMFRPNTVHGGHSVAGELYFEIPKDQHKIFNPRLLISRYCSKDLSTSCSSESGAEEMNLHLGGPAISRRTLRNKPPGDGAGRSWPRRQR